MGIVNNRFPLQANIGRVGARGGSGRICIGPYDRVGFKIINPYAYVQRRHGFWKENIYRARALGRRMPHCLPGVVFCNKVPARSEVWAPYWSAARAVGGRSVAGGNFLKTLSGGRRPTLIGSERYFRKTSDGAQAPDTGW